MSFSITKSVVGLALAMGAAGCSKQVQPDPVDPKPEDPSFDPEATPDAAALPLPPRSTFRFFGALANGVVPPQDTFETEAHAYIDAGGAGATVGKYWFEVQYLVHPPSGTDSFHGSSDAPACRTFHVTAGGQIDLLVGADAGCGHRVGVDASGGLTVSLMPFDLNPTLMIPDAMGRFAFTVRIAPEGESFFGESSTGFTFHVGPAAPPPPVCGDGHLDAGEECDDGNLDYNDGCSGTCKVEHLCCCGNGVVEPGEQCDDGNHDDGDGCSSTCTQE